jgi:hypothetical protein
MPTPPHRLQPDTSLADNLALINDNFDKVVSDMVDLGARFSSVGRIQASVVAGTSVCITLGLIDTLNQYQPGRLQIVPRLETFVDNDLNDNYLLGYTNSLTTGQQNVLVLPWPQRRPGVGDVADVGVFIHNFDVANHVYYCYVDESYMASPPVGNFR